MHGAQQQQGAGARRAAACSGAPPVPPTRAEACLLADLSTLEVVSAFTSPPGRGKHMATVGDPPAALAPARGMDDGNRLGDPEAETAPAPPAKQDGPPPATTAAAAAPPADGTGQSGPQQPPPPHPATPAATHERQRDPESLLAQPLLGSGSAASLASSAAESVAPQGGGLWARFKRAVHRLKCEVKALNYAIQASPIAACRQRQGRAAVAGSSRLCSQGGGEARFPPCRTPVWASCPACWPWPPSPTCCPRWTCCRCADSTNRAVCRHPAPGSPAADSAPACFRLLFDAVLLPLCRTSSP